MQAAAPWKSVVDKVEALELGWLEAPWPCPGVEWIRLAGLAAGESADGLSIDYPGSDHTMAVVTIS